jgi:NADPH:quinone reductase-like Zn-dependent oxidoreductase
MKINAVVASTYGGPEVLEVVETELAGPRPGEVLVEVRAAGTNPIDYKLYSGTYGDDRTKLPMRLGFEASGVVTSVNGEGEGPTGPIREGDNVIVYSASGAYASAIVAPVANVVAKPSTLTFDEASGLMLTGTTAVHAWHAVGVAPGDTVVVHGAAGGVGLMAVQLAVDDGARVIGTAGEAQHELLRRLGAEPVAYGEGLLERIRALAPHGVDAALDLVGTDEATDVSLALVADRQRVATIVGSSKATQLGIQVLGAGPGADPGTEIRAKARRELVRRADAGTLRVLVAESFSMSDAPSAHRLLIEGHVHGKIVLFP